MSTQTTAVAKREKFDKAMNVMGGKLREALPKHIDLARFTRIVSTAVGRNPALMDTTPASFFGSLLLAAQLGLEPNGPDQKCFLIPYKDQCQFQLGYRGLLDLARRSGELSSIHAEIAYENDELEIILGLNPTIIHKPLLKGERGAAVLAYSVATLKDGSKDFTWMNVEEIEKARKANRGKSPAWESWWSEMAKKVVMKRHLKTLPLNAEIQRAVNSDETVKANITSDMTEAQERETMEEIEASIVENTRATSEDKAQFYESAKNAGLAHLITMQENTQIAAGCDLDFLASITADLPNRKQVRPDPFPAQERTAPVQAGKNIADVL
jgi:recombination protein RecT